MKTARLLALASSSVMLFAIACGSSPTADDRTMDEDPIHGTGSSSGFGPGGETSSSSGSSGSTCAATKADTAKAKVDIIFVIDNSGSMNEEMNQIKTNVNNFAAKIGGVGLDYHVVFIVRKASSPTQGGNYICVPAPLAGANCADNPPIFQHVNQNVQSNDSFRLILSTYDQWKASLRVDATKVFVEVTDDESNLKTEEFDAALLAKEPAGMFGTAAKRNYIFHSIVSMPAGKTPPTTDRCPTSDGTSVQYQKLSVLTGGIIDEVCKTDYSGVLDNIAKGIVDRLGCELGYPKAEAADPSKLVVAFTPKGGAAKNLTQLTDVSKCDGVQDGWYYDDNANPTKIILCPTMCKTVNEAEGSKIEALVGCKAPAPR